MLKLLLDAISGLNTAVIASKLCQDGRIDEARALMLK